MAYRAPFVSGKDSLNNEYVGTDGQRHAVPPTLVITAVAHVPDADRCVTPDLAEPGNVLVLIGTTRPEFAGSHLDLVLGRTDRRRVRAGARPRRTRPLPAPPPAMRAGLVSRATT
jgi:phosphoribosylformylglycinamidine synthase subunit PurSL